MNLYFQSLLSEKKRTKINVIQRLFSKEVYKRKMNYFLYTESRMLWLETRLFSLGLTEGNDICLREKDMECFWMIRNEDIVYKVITQQYRKRNLLLRFNSNVVRNIMDLIKNQS
jgi:hypothetical protein